ncbi:hypothetical protein SRABI118_03196 [Massilia sp. Bi118]|uniref:hypothetical protein n=1 Tax=Massilia sp. Bi118 TaxID=2822346 RepID=UPI001DD541A4|nr:hypothetical protein [Massilia sp. Bi118]CAH0260141.1 hypothetical protein SRABI118_03196 [Massilia sp. Bi118]
MKRMPMPVAAGALLILAVAGMAWRPDLRALLAGYLALWWFGIGVLLGGLANVWLHQLTGGAWGETIRPPLLRAARWLPLACLLFLPVLLGMRLLYPWAGGQVPEPATDFRRWWFDPVFFIVRSVLYLAIWSLLAWIETRARSRSAARAAACLLAYGFSVSLAAADWIMSLQPEWYSSVFGWLAATGQMLAGLALAVLLIDREAARQRLPDLGNLLMMYVLTWAYLAYVQFLIIWAADLPREIAWYLRRDTPAWHAVAWGLLALHGAGPLIILLSRHAKQAPRVLGALAVVLLAAHVLDCWWLVLPSVGRAVHG